MFEKITKTLSGLAFIKYINSLIDYVNTSDIDATRIKGQLDISNIPPAGLDNVIKVDTVTDMLALTVDDVQNGDTVMIIGVTPPVQYQVVDDTKLGTMDAFQEYAAGTATKALADINGNNIHTTYGKLAGTNTWTGTNYWNGSAIFNANLNIRGSATTPGDSSTYLGLGLKPEGSKQTPSIARNKQGDLVMYAADYRSCYLRSGIQTSFASVYKSDGTVEFSSLNNTPWGKYTKNGLELTVYKTPTVNNDVPNKKYVDDSVASATADLLSSNNTWTGSNTYNSNIVVKANGTAEVVEGSVYLGRSSKTNQARITGDATGNLYLTNSEDGYTYINNGSNSVAYFGNATIKFYKPTYITNGSSAGSSATLYLGVKPTNETVQARIGTDKLGGLFYHASTNQPHVFRVGTNNNVFVIRDDNTKVTFSSNNIPFATVTHDGVAKWLGNANTATKLQTARTINGVAFDGTQDITINCDAGSGSNLTTYTSLEQIGITPGEETFASIHSALPINSVLEYYASEAQNFADIYPASYGNFIATRLTGDITIFHFTGTNQTMYVTHYHVTNNTNPSWTQIAKQSDLTNLSNSVVKSVNGIKPTNGNVTIDIPKPVIASEAEAEAGTNNTKFMSPLRVKQAISALAGDSSWTISKGTNGWARENSTGLTVQWGYVNRSNISGTFTFPRTFTTCYYSNVMCSSNLVPYIKARSNTSITFNTNNGYNDDIQNWGDCYIFAIGVS